MARQRSEESKAKNREYMKMYNKSTPPVDWNRYLIKKHEYKKETLELLEIVYDNSIEELDIENKEEK